MTDLTEQWKKGELEDGFYYVKSSWSDEIEVRYVHNGIDEYECIVAPVPSYEEWQKVLNIDFNNEVLRLENQQFKELLKECQYMILAYSINHDTFTKEKVLDTIKQIDNAIGEK